LTVSFAYTTTNDRFVNKESDLEWGYFSTESHSDAVEFEEILFQATGIIEAFFRAVSKTHGFLLRLAVFKSCSCF